MRTRRTAAAAVGAPAPRRKRTRTAGAEVVRTRSPPGRGAKALRRSRRKAAGAGGARQPGFARLENVLASADLGVQLCYFCDGWDLEVLGRASRTARDAVRQSLELQWRTLHIERRIGLGRSNALSALRFPPQTPLSVDLLRRAAGLYEAQCQTGAVPDSNYLLHRRQLLGNAGAGAGPRTAPFLTPVIRQVLVDWMAEVCTVELVQPPRVLHAAVRLLDLALSKIMVTSRDLLLAGCVTILIESQAAREDGSSDGTEDATGGTAPVEDATTVTRRGGRRGHLGVQDIVYVTANQFNGFEVCKLYNIIVSNCKGIGAMPAPTAPTALNWLDFLEDYLNPPPPPPRGSPSREGSDGAAARKRLAAANLQAPSRSGTTRAMAAATPPPALLPEVRALARFLTSLSLLDYGMLQFLPSTTAAAAMILAQLTVKYYDLSSAAPPPPGDQGAREAHGYTDAEPESAELGATGLAGATAASDGPPPTTSFAYPGLAQAGTRPADAKVAVPETLEGPEGRSWCRGWLDVVRASREETAQVQAAVWRLWRAQRDYLDYFMEMDVLAGWAQTSNDAFTEWWSRNPRCTRYCREDLQPTEEENLCYTIAPGRTMPLPRVLEPHPQIRGHLRGIERIFQTEGVDLHGRKWTTKGPARPTHVQRTLQRLLSRV